MSTPAAGTRARSVVVIDDDIDQLELTVLLLQLAGHRAVGSTESADAVALMLREGADIAVLDFMLSDRTSRELCEAMRTAPGTRGVRIVMLSSTPETEIRRSCIAYDTFLRKPVDRKMLLEAIETV